MKISSLIITIFLLICIGNVAAFAQQEPSKIDLIQSDCHTESITTSQVGWRCEAAEGASDTKLTTLKLKSKNSDGAPYLFSEVAGSPDACSDSFSITYGSGGSINYALMGKRNNTWNYLGHVLAHYFYENCTSNINDLANQRHETVLPETRTTCDGCQVW